MSKSLTIALVIFSLIWIFIIIRDIRKDKMAIKYSLIWFLMAITLLFVGLFRLPYNIYAGGGIIDIANRIEVKDEYHESGSFNMAYVKSVKATIPVYLLSYVFNWERESIESVKLDENDNPSDMIKLIKTNVQIPIKIINVKFTN